MSANVCTPEGLSATGGPADAHALGEAGDLGHDDVAQLGALPARLGEQLVRVAERLQPADQDFARLLDASARLSACAR